MARFEWTAAYKTSQEISMFAKCLAISNNSPMIANNFSHFGFVFMACFYQGHFFSFYLFIFNCSSSEKCGLNIMTDFLLVKSFRMQNSFPVERKSSLVGIFRINQASSRKKKNHPRVFQNGRKVEEEHNPSFSVSWNAVILQHRALAVSTERGTSVFLEYNTAGELYVS